MSTPAWQLEGSQARLEIAGLRATLDAPYLDAGLTGIVAAGEPLVNLRLLAVERPASNATGRPASPTECYLRGNDLVATCRESPAWPVQVDAVWRAVSLGGEARTLAAVDLVLSAHTNVLDGRPQLAIATTAPESPAFRLTDRAAAVWQSVELPAGHVQILEPSTGCGCLLLRLPGGAWSYAEMLHPVDFHRDQLTIRDPGCVQLRHQLFPETLEKGVLVRARLRGVWVARAGDLETAAACYAAFAAGEPPLGT